MSSPSHSPAIARLLPSVSNFRDLGGHVGLQGRRVRPGRVYRSDHLGGLTRDDLQKLQALGLTHRIDFRGVAESAALPSDVAGLTPLALSIEPTVVQRVQALLGEGKVLTETQAEAMMCDTYRGFVREGAPVYARFFRHLLEQTTPMVFHCTAGKDRTGFAAALLLSALGVAHDDIVRDYLLTNAYYQRSPLVESRGPAQVMNVLWTVRPAFLQAAFTHIDEEFGGLPRYLEGPMGLGPRELAHLRASLLQA